MIAKTNSQRKRLIKQMAKEYGIWVPKPTRKIRRPKMSKELDTHNINHYTDSSKYADQFYGDAVRDTKNMDNDWN